MIFGDVGPTRSRTTGEWDLWPCRTPEDCSNVDDMSERGELRVLSRTECLELLGTAWIGRVILTSNAMPTAVPVNFVLDGDGIVFRSGEGMKLTAAEAGTVVAFEVDHFDPQLRMGWSVLVTGLARRIREPDELRRAHALNIPTWVGPSTDWAYARIEGGRVTGRRLVPFSAGTTAGTSTGTVAVVPG